MCVHVSVDTAGCSLAHIRAKSEVRQQTYPLASDRLLPNNLRISPSVNAWASPHNDRSPITVTGMKRSDQRALYDTTPRDAAATARIEDFRVRAREGSLSYGDIYELETDLVAHIDPDDTEMLPWADVAEADE
jgi:hypothetical protein